MSKIIQASEYTPINPHLLGWTVKPKPKPLVKKQLVKGNQKSTWAKEGMGTKDVYSGDLLSQMYEDTDKLLAPQRFPNQEDFKQKERRMGKRMLHTEFVKKVLSLNRNLVCEDSIGCKGSAAFYLWRNGKLGPEKIYTAACFRKGWLPEWTVMETDTADLPTQDGLTYGYRTVLQRLIQRRCITKAQVNKTFGMVTRQDLCGKNWNLFTGDFQ